MRIRFSLAIAALAALALPALAEPVKRPVAISIASSFEDASTKAAVEAMRAGIGKSADLTLSPAKPGQPTLKIKVVAAAKIGKDARGGEEMVVEMLGGWSDGAIDRTFYAKCEPKDPAACGRAGAIWAGKYVVDRDHGE